MVKIAVLGYGTVGSGVVEVLATNKESINKRAGQEIEIKYVLDLRDFPGTPVEDLIVHDIDIILNDPEIKVVIEVMGGVEPAYTFVKRAIENGKSVVTSNKELVAKHGAALLKTAKENHLNFLFEASVGGGIPIIRPLNQSLTADEITQISGILNGTTNYILTKMAKEGLEFDTVLKEAQEKGYAERNPRADVEGFDSCRKIAILSSLAFGSQVDYEDIYTEGITKITDKDFKYAEKMNRVIKLLASSKKVGEQFYAFVAPVMLGEDHPLYNVNGVLNGIYINGNVIGDVMFFGAGAGKLPTASAVVTDVIDCIKHLSTNIMSIWNTNKLELADIFTSKKEFFLRVSGNAEEKLPEIKAAFGEVQLIYADGLADEFGLITEMISEAEYKENAEKVSGILNRIRIEN